MTPDLKSIIYSIRAKIHRIPRLQARDISIWGARPKAVILCLFLHLLSPLKNNQHIKLFCQRAQELYMCLSQAGTQGWVPF